MKAAKFFIGAVLVASLSLNIFLWRQREKERSAVKAAQAEAVRAGSALAKAEWSLKNRASAAATGESRDRELARLRNEVGQLRTQLADAEAKKGEAIRETAKLQAQVANAAQKMQELKKESSELLTMTPEQIAAARERAMAIRCVNNMKQIGLAVRLYANDNQNVFPPDLLSMKDELTTPKVLFCPSTGVQVQQWSEVNPTTISYQFLNPGGNESDPQKLLLTCPIHGHTGFSDGSVQMKR
jgi:hypothetical protein